MAIHTAMYVYIAICKIIYIVSTSWGRRLDDCNHEDSNKALVEACQAMLILCDLFLGPSICRS